MKTHAQNMIDRVKWIAEKRCGARQATELLDGDWQAQGVAACPVCGTAEALRIRENDDCGIVTFCCVEGCSPIAIAKAVGEILNAQGVETLDRPPWAGDE